MSPQVAAEARSVAVRKLKIGTEDAAKAILGLLPWCTAPYGADEVRRALALQARWRLSWWDSLLIASALAAGCTHFVTEDGQTAPAIEGLRLIDPFVTAPGEILAA
jgi:predicted nucleic acid-binding protein